MTQGPHLISAVICDQVIEGKDGVLSAIRIIDQVTMMQLAEGEDKQIQLPQLPQFARLGPILQFSILVLLKSGDFKGKGKLRLAMQTPSGKSAPEQAVEVELFGEQHGSNVIFNVGLAPQEAGLYWFEIYFGDRLLTKSPLQIQLAQSSLKTTNGEGAAQNQAEKKQ